MKQVGETLFRAVCLIVAAGLLVASLLCGIRCTAWNDVAARRLEQVELLREENARLRARCETLFSLEEIERYAQEELGMQRLSGEQMILVYGTER